MVSMHKNLNSVTISDSKITSEGIH